MLQSIQHQNMDREDSQWNNLCRFGGVVALLQLICLLIFSIAPIILGGEPQTAAEYYTMLQEDRFLGFMRLDFATLLLLCLIPFPTFGIFAALRRSSKPYAALGTALVFVGVVLSLANHPAFSMIRLSDQYAAAAGAGQREQLLAAGEAVIASNMWNSTAGFLAGIFMQGAFVFISAVMLKSREFSKGTAYSGIIANGLDLAHVFVALFSPSLAIMLLSVGGLFYLAWFPLLARDLIRVGRGVSLAQNMAAQPA